MSDLLAFLRTPLGAGIALLLACAAMLYQPDEPTTVHWSANDGAQHYGR